MATAEQALAWVNQLYARLVARRPEVEKRWRYVDGQHPLVFATEEWKKFHEDRYTGFSDNWCDVVANSPVDRLRIDGFRLSDTTDIVTDDEKQLWNDWQRNEMTAQSNQGILSTVVASRSAVLVWGDENDEPEVSWKRPDQVVVEYSATGRRRTAALKAWVEDDTEYVTLYLPTEVWKYQRSATLSEDSRKRLEERGVYLPAILGTGGGWVAREVPSETWPLLNPLGVVPVVEWLNRPRLGGAPVSDITGVMAMQDAINSMWAYLFASADYASMPARVVLGAEPPKVPILDENGQVIGARPAKMDDLAGKRLLFIPNATNISQWEAAKSDFFLGVISEGIGHIAAQTRTPGHYLLTNEKFANLNGDALTAAEVPLASKCENFQTHANPSVKQVAALMALVRDKKDLAESILVADGRRFVQWKDPAMHSLAQVADAATKDRAVGMSLRTVLERRYGMTEPEIDRELRRIDAERPPDPVGQALAGELSAGQGATGGQ